MRSRIPVSTLDKSETYLHGFLIRSQKMCYLQQISRRRESLIILMKIPRRLQRDADMVSNDTLSSVNTIKGQAIIRPHQLSTLLLHIILFVYVYVLFHRRTVFDVLFYGNKVEPIEPIKTNKSGQSNQGTILICYLLSVVPL